MSHSFADADTDSYHTNTNTHQQQQSSQSASSYQPDPYIPHEGSFNNDINTSNIDFNNDQYNTQQQDQEVYDIGGGVSNEIIVYENFRSLLRPAAAEFVGSALFVFLACGAGMTTTNYQTVGSTTIGIALTFGITIFVLAYTIGHISGGHLNFAVTFTFTILRKISILKCILYFFAQWIGGMVGIGFLKLITPLEWWKSCFATNFVHPDLTVGHAFLAELILTFFLMFVVMAACDSNKSNQTLVPLAIGMAVFCAHMIGLPITGCSINPTRTFASAVAASGVEGCDAWNAHWVFWLAPILGASLAGILYEYCYHEGGYKVDALIDQYIVKKEK